MKNIKVSELGGLFMLLIVFFSFKFAFQKEKMQNWFCFTLNNKKSLAKIRWLFILNSYLFLIEII